MKKLITVDVQNKEKSVLDVSMNIKMLLETAVSHNDVHCEFEDDDNVPFPFLTVRKMSLWNLMLMK